MQNESVSEIAFKHTFEEIYLAMKVNGELLEGAKRDWKWMTKTEWYLAEVAAISKMKRKLVSALQRKIRAIPFSNALAKSNEAC